MNRDDIIRMAYEAMPEIAPDITEEELERFAELIIRKCADIATVNQYKSYAPGHYVLKHFGVEK